VTDNEVLVVVLPATEDA